MVASDLKFLSSRESIPSDISMLDNIDVDYLRRYWKAFKTSSNVLPGGHRLENLFWRMWGSERLHKTLSGSRIAILFIMIQQGEEAFKKTPKLRIPEFGKAVHPPIQPVSRLPPGGSLEIPPTPPPSPIESQFTGPGGRPPMSRLLSQGDIAESLQAILQLRQIPVRSSPPNPPPPSPATPMASPLLAAVQAKFGNAGYFAGIERPGVVSSNSDNTMMSVSSTAIAPPRNPPRPSNVTRKSGSSSTLPVLEEAVPTPALPAQQKGLKRSDSVVSIAESTTSSMSANVGKKAAAGNKSAKKGTLPKGKAKFAAGKKVGLRPALSRQKSSTSSTVVENEEGEEEGEEYDELAEAKNQESVQQKPLLAEIVKIGEKRPVVEEKKPVVGLLKSAVEVQKATGEVKKPVMEKAPVEKKPVLEVVSDIEEGDDFEDEEPRVAPPPMRRTISAGPALGGKKSKKGSTARLSKKKRNVSVNAGREAPGLGIAAALGGPGTQKEVGAPTPLPVVSIVEPDFRRKFQERNNIMRTTSEDNISTNSGNSSPGSAVSAADSNGKSKRREKLAFLTSEMEPRAVKSQATVSIATPTSSVVVAKKMHGQNVLVVESGEIKGLNSQKVPVAARKMETDNVNGVSIGGSGGAGSRKSTLSLMIEDAKRKNGGKVGGGTKESASLSRI